MRIPSSFALTGLVTLGALTGAYMFGGTPALAAEGLSVTGTFGSSSSNPSDPYPLYFPEGVAVNQERGTVYVSDSGNNRVEYFNAAGDYEGQFNGSENPSFPTGFYGPRGIAVDNSCFYEGKSGSECAALDPSNGDVYVIDYGHEAIDKLSATGGFISQLGTFSQRALRGVAVDSSGNLWVASYSYQEEKASVVEYGDTGTLEKTLEVTNASALAVDSIDASYLAGGSGALVKYSATGTQLNASETQAISPVSALTVDLASNDLYVGLGNSIAQYGPFGEPFGAPLRHSDRHSLEVSAVALNSTSHTVYVAEASASKVAIVQGVSGNAPAAPKTDTPVVRAEQATLNGDLNPEGAGGGVGYFFSYAPGSSCTGPGQNTTPFDNGGSNIAGSSDVHVSAHITGLQPETEYSFCVSVESAFGEASGSPVTFTTASPYATFEPTIERESASNATPYDATLEAQITTENQATEYYFEYSPSEAELLAGKGSRNRVTVGPLEGNLYEQALTEDLGGVLAPNTTYYYRVIAKNAAGTTDGPMQTFRTLTLQKPTVETGSSSIGAEATVQLSGSVNPEFQVPTECAFQFATQEATILTGTPHSAPCQPGAAELGNGDSPIPVASGILYLASNETVYYRLVAANVTGESDGTIKQFTTFPNPPVVKTGATSNLGPYSATVAGTVNPGSSGHPANDDTTYHFEYGTSKLYNEGQVPITPGDAGEGNKTVAEQGALSNLVPNTTYYYRLVASNDNDNTEGGKPQVVYGEGKSFTTLATAPILGETVSKVTQTTATVSSAIDPRGLLTHWELLIGVAQGELSYQAAGNVTGEGPRPVTVSIGSLAPASTHYYKLIAENPDGSVESAEASFTTATGPPPPPPALATPPLALPNIAYPAEEGVIITQEKAPSKKLTKAQQLAKALKACAKKPRNKRAKCRKQARERYGGARNGKR